MREIDVEEAKRYTECSDCEQGLYVYDSRGYPSDTGAICFDCLRKRYETLRDAKPGPATKAVMHALRSIMNETGQGESIWFGGQLFDECCTMDQVRAFLAEQGDA